MPHKNDSSICRLCNEEKSLCNSHIIPEFCYKLGYDEKHRIGRLETNPLRETLLQKGLRDHLLCYDCESRIGKYEHYFSQVWYKKRFLPSIIHDKGISITGIDYGMFKLFLLSVLWRASVSSLKEFQNVSMGKRHEEKLRNMLRNGDPGKPTEYPFFALVLVDDKDRVIHGLITQPGRSRLEGHTVYPFVMAGCCWYFVVSSHPVPEAILQAMSTSGTLTLAKMALKDFHYAGEFARHYLAAKKK